MTKGVSELRTNKQRVWKDWRIRLNKNRRIREAPLKAKVAEAVAVAVAVVEEPHMADIPDSKDEISVFNTMSLF